MTKQKDLMGNDGRKRLSTVEVSLRKGLRRREGVEKKWVNGKEISFGTKKYTYRVERRVWRYYRT